MFTHSISVNDGVTRMGEWPSEESFRAALPPAREWSEGGDSIVMGERHVESSGFSAARLVTLMDMFVQAKDAGVLESKPKLAGLYVWLQTVKGAAISGATEFPPAPYVFEEVLSE